MEHAAKRVVKVLTKKQEPKLSLRSMEANVRENLLKPSFATRTNAHVIF